MDLLVVVLVLTVLRPAPLLMLDLPPGYFLLGQAFLVPFSFSSSLLGFSLPASLSNSACALSRLIVYDVLKAHRWLAYLCRDLI